jgi:type I site-specific restriction-modification system R (restriction) subunit
MEARLQRINEHATNAIKEATKNAEAGISKTDVIVPKDISYAVRDLLEEMLKASNTKFTWNVVARGNNEYTGRPQSYISESVGDDRRYQLQIL